MRQGLALTAAAASLDRNGEKEGIALAAMSRRLALNCQP